ncbi:hypothetical protein Aperf_G00000031575 [Anoplocephala perfoliata]
MNGFVNEEVFHREALILEALRGAPNIIELYAMVKNCPRGGPCFVLEYVESDDFFEFTQGGSPQEVAFYMYELLRALDACHKIGIIHRDVKPKNVLINRRNKILRLIDFDCARIFHPGLESSLNFGKLNYMSPELLMGYKKYDYAIDMWSFGCMLAALIFKKEVMFKGQNRICQLIEIVKVVGHEKLIECQEKYNLKLDTRVIRRTAFESGKPWESFVNEKNKGHCTESALHLIGKLLVLDHSKRLTAEEAMEHPYFCEVLGHSPELFL